MFVNGSFENGWKDFPPTADNLTNQRPNGWKCRWLPAGEDLWGSGPAEGIPELVHKHKTQLPPDEQLGALHALILDGEWTYKPFHRGLPFGVELWQEVTGLVPGSTAKVVAPMMIHANDYKNGVNDQHMAETGAWLLTQWTADGDICNAVGGVGKWVPFTDAREWDDATGWKWFYHGDPTKGSLGSSRMEVIVPDSGKVAVLLRFKSKWREAIDFFVDNVQFIGQYDDGGTEPPPTPDPELEQRVSELEQNQAAMSSQIQSLTLRIQSLEDVAHEHDGTIPPTPEDPLEIKFEHGALLVDLSNGNNDVNYNELKEEGVQGLIVRATSGKRYSSTDNEGTDLRFWEHITGGKEAELPLGSYFFLNNEEPVVEQVVRFVANLNAAFDDGFTFPLGVFYDVEDEYSPKSEATFMFAAEQLVELIDEKIFGNTKLLINGKEVTRRIGVYSRGTWWNRYVPANAKWPKEMDLMCWVANWVNDSTDDLEELPSPNWKFILMNGWSRDDVNYWQFTSTGGLLVGHHKMNLDLNYVVDQSGIIITPPEVVDVLPFIKGSHRVQFDKEYVLANNKTGTETIQIWHLDADNWLHIKGNGQYWHLGLRKFDDVEYICMFEDTSESMTRWFSHHMLENGPMGAWWVPRFMEVGKDYEFPKFVQHYNKKNLVDGYLWKGDCSKANSGNVVDRMKLLSKPYNRDYNGTVLPVITFQWAGGEEYDFAGGNVAFRNTAGDRYWFKSYLQGRQDKFKEIVKPSCVNIWW